MNHYRTLGTLRSVLGQTPWPADFFNAVDLDEILDQVHVLDYTTQTLSDSIATQFDLALPQEVSLQLPGLDGLNLVIGGKAPGLTFLDFSLDLGLEPRFAMNQIDLALRWDTGMFTPASFDGSPVDREHAEILFSGSLEIDHNFNLHLDTGDGLYLPPVMIGNSGVIIEAEGIKADLSRTSDLPEVSEAGYEPGFMGFYMERARIQLPHKLAGFLPDDLILEDCLLGSGGFTGSLRVELDYEVDTENKRITGEGAGDLLGFQFGIDTVELDLFQNSFRKFEVTGTIWLPYLDQALPVTVGFDHDGEFNIAFNGNLNLPPLRIPDVLDFSVEGLGFEELDGSMLVKLSGNLLPTFGGQDWPEIEIKELGIDAIGNVLLDGGWLDLPEQYSLDFYGFPFDLTKLGFGKNDLGANWVGFSGGLNLIEGLPAGVSVEGLRITWDGDNVDVSFDGIGVEFEVEDVIRFKGAVNYTNDENGHRFDGLIQLDLPALDLSVDGQLVIGKRITDGESFNYMGIYLGLDLPGGLPLFATGLGIYGMSGLFTMQMSPDKAPDASWYDWFESTRGGTEKGVTDLRKWQPEKDALGFGAGLTIGTLADNGFLFSGKMLLAFVFPGPIILIDGKASLMQPRANLDSDPVFRANAVIDNREKSFRFTLDAQYRYGSGGQLIDIGGRADTFFHLDKPDEWYFHLGKDEPRDERIKAEIFSLFEANAYFMLDSSSLKMGSWTGYDEAWEFGPLGVGIEAWTETNAHLSWSPAHFHGGMQLHGQADLSVYGYGSGVAITAGIWGDVFQPFQLLGRFGVGINLPWPLPDFAVDLEILWGEAKPAPEIPPLLKEVAVEHLKVKDAWPLEPTNEDNEHPNNDMPVVPLDGRPHITFNKPVASPIPSWGGGDAPAREIIGDATTGEGTVELENILERVELSKWNPKTEKYEAVETPVFGSWAPVPEVASNSGRDPEAANTKLWLWTKTPFDYARQLGNSWNEWVEENFENYPCPPAPEWTKNCIDFEGVDDDLLLELSDAGPGFANWQHPEHNLSLHWTALAANYVQRLPEPVEGKTKGIRFPGSSAGQPIVAIILLPEPVRRAEVLTVAEGDVRAIGLANGNVPVTDWEIADEDGRIRLDLADPLITAIALATGPVDSGVPTVILPGSEEKDFFLAQVCTFQPPTAEQEDRYAEQRRHIADMIETWSGEGTVLEPHSTYQLGIFTRQLGEGIDDYAREGNGFNFNREKSEYVYFRTEGPPGLTELSPSVSPSEEESALDDLNLYVRQTLPEAVPAEGEQPELPGPWYRATDIGVEFNEDYVDQLYRSVGKDLNLYLYNSNNEPVRDAEGRLIVMSNRLGKAPERVLSESELSHIRTMDGASCAVDNLPAIPLDTTLTSLAEKRVLDGNTVYEARLTPLLFSDDFTGDQRRWATVTEGTRERQGNPWQTRQHNGWSGSRAVVDPNFPDGNVIHLQDGADLELGPGVDLLVLESDRARTHQTFRIEQVLDNNRVSLDGAPDLRSSPSQWQVPAMGALVQVSNVHDVPTDGRDPLKPGTIYHVMPDLDLPSSHPNQPYNWSDYRMTCNLRASDDDALGVVFRYSERPDHGRCYYRFSMDSERQYRQLVKVVNEENTILARDSFTYEENRTYQLMIEAVGPSLRIYLDGQLVFDVTDPSLQTGSVGFYTWGSRNAVFSQLLIDDFREEANTVYRYAFRTSHYANFFHHLHSHENISWQQDVPDGINVADQLEQAVLPTTAPNQNEFDHYATLADALGGEPAVGKVESTRIEVDGNTLAWWLRSPEPLLWDRTTLNGVYYRYDRIAAGHAPGHLKLTGLRSGESRPNEERVDLLLREAADLSNHRIQTPALIDPVSQSGEVLFYDDFDDEGGCLYHEEFGPQSLRYNYKKFHGDPEQEPLWTVSPSDHIRQTKRVGRDGLNPAVPAALDGALLLTGKRHWDNLHLSVDLSNSELGLAGVVFRATDENNYYRLAVGDGYNHQLARVVNGEATVLWDAQIPWQSDAKATLDVRVFGKEIVGHLDGRLLFALEDETHTAGQVGLMTWYTAGAVFGRVAVHRLERSPLQFGPGFGEILPQVVNPILEDGSPSEWQLDAGELVQSLDLEPEPGDTTSYALLDVELPVETQINTKVIPPETGECGILFNATPREAPEEGSPRPQLYDFLLFSLEREMNASRLVLSKHTNEGIEVLWSANQVAWIRTHDLGVRLQKGRIELFFNGQTVETIANPMTTSGRVGLYTRAASTTRFVETAVLDLARRVGSWRVVDEGTVSGPSRWTTFEGQLHQGSNLFRNLAPSYPGTYVVADGASWDDVALEATLRSDDDDAIGLIFRYRDADNYYRFSMDAQRQYQMLVVVAEGETRILAREPRGYDLGQDQQVKIEAIGSTLRVWLNGVVILEADDATHATGTVGLYSWGNDGARFDRVRVTRPPASAYRLYRDRFAEGFMEEWTEWFVPGGRAHNANEGWKLIDGLLHQTSNIFNNSGGRLNPGKFGTTLVTGEANWTDLVFDADIYTNDDDELGMVFRYVDENNHYRFVMNQQVSSYRRIVKVENGEATVLWEDDFRYEKGITYRFRLVLQGESITAFMDGHLVGHARDAAHPRGQIGFHCWASDKARFANVQVFKLEAFERWTPIDERWEAPVLTNWSVANEEVALPGSWSIDDHQLTQGEATTDPDSGDAIGTMVLSDETLADFRVGALLTPGEDGSAGLIFRAEDVNHHYRVVITAGTNTLRLERKAGDRVTVLESVNTPLTGVKTYALGVDAMENGINVYLNGQLQLAVEDTAFAAGQIGLYTAGNGSAVFNRVHVQPMGWADYYHFGREARLPAGTQVQVYSGRQIDDLEQIDTNPNVEQRFVTGPADDAGALRLQGSERWLQIVDADGTIVHRRQFKPDELQPLDVRILRKADGTGCFLAVPGALSFLPADYFTEWTYHREADSGTWPQAGDTSDETVTIHLPWNQGE